MSSGAMAKLQRPRLARCKLNHPFDEVLVPRGAPAKPLIARSNLRAFQTSGEGEFAGIEKRAERFAQARSVCAAQFGGSIVDSEIELMLSNLRTWCRRDQVCPIDENTEHREGERSQVRRLSLAAVWPLDPR